MRVQVRDGTVYEGVMHTASTTGPGFGVVLKQARVVPSLDAVVNAGGELRGARLARTRNSG